MPRKRAAPKWEKKPRRPSGIRGSQKAADPNLRRAAEAVLTTVRRIKGKIADETDPAERRRLRRLLNHTNRKVRAYRQALEELALQVPQLASWQLVEQISSFVLLEEEFLTDAQEARSRSN